MSERSPKPERHPKKIEHYIEANEKRFIAEMQEWLALPSISGLPEYAGDVRKAAQWAMRKLQHLGFPVTELVEEKGLPLVFAEWQVAADRPTLLLYGHYDVQPVDPLDEWKSPPFVPEVRDGYIYGRGTADDKGQIMILFAALESWLAVYGSLPVNVKVVLEGEEEAGGNLIERFVTTQAERLACDSVLICDTHMNGLDEPSIITGLRGILYAEIKVKGAASDLHSGTFGGVAPNPLHALCLLCARLKGEDGKINIAGLYEKEVSVGDDERQFWQRDGARFSQDLKNSMHVSTLVGEEEYSVHERLGIRPTFEIHGIQGGFIGEGAKTVIPAEATAKVSLRLPAGHAPQEVFELLQQSVAEYMPAGYRYELSFLHGGEGFALSAENEVLQGAVDAVTDIYGVRPVFMREGGSIPIAPLFEHILHVPVVLLGFGLPDDGIHGPNERFSLQQFSRGIATVCAYLKRLAVV